MKRDDAFGARGSLDLIDALFQMIEDILRVLRSSLGLLFRNEVSLDVSQVAPPVTDSYREFAWGLYRFVSRPFYRPVGLPSDK